MHCVLAVDGGNTKTIALVAGLDGTVLGVGRSGCTDIYNATSDDNEADSAEQVALANFDAAVLTALGAAAVEPTDLDVGVLNMAGADWPEDIDFWQKAATVRGWGRRVISQNDALGVLYAGSPDATGVSIVCGTGAATGARSQDGRVWHSSFWQDEAQGSTHLGQKALFAVYRAELGIGPPTSLTGRILQYFGVESVEEVLHLYHNRLRPAPVSVDHLTPMLLDEAQAGDLVAQRVVQQHGAALGDFAIVAARRVGIAELSYPLVLAGGVFRHPTTLLEDAIVERVAVVSPAVRPVRSPHEPIVGVLFEALIAAGIEIDEALQSHLLASIRASELIGAPALYS